MLLAMVLFTVWFSIYSVRWHEAHLTHKADLGQIDLAIWNTSRGRLLQEIKDDYVSTRLTDHVELIFLPVSAVFWLWNDVRALLVLQAVALALGAWPIYLLARRKLEAPSAGGKGGNVQAARAAAWGGVVFAIAYLLSPALQSAAVSEFHALPLAVPLIAWALWELECRQWGWFALMVLLLVIVQEGMALLGATLGLYALVRIWHLSRNGAGTPHEAAGDSFLGNLGDVGPPAGQIVPGIGLARRGAGEAPRPLREESSAPSPSQVRMGLQWLARPGRAPAAVGGAAIAMIVIAGSLAWFYLTTFVIIPHYAGQVYGVEQTPYIGRYGALGDSFGDVLRALITQPRLVLSIVLEPLRLRYLVGLLIPTAFLALLGPGLLLVSLPLLLANLLSAYPLQYSGELHYSAPLVPLFIMAGAAGLAWLLRRLPRQTPPEGGRGRGTSQGLAKGPLFSWASPYPWFGLVLLGALSWQIVAGYTPLGREFWRRYPGGWPKATAHERLLERFVAQIPKEAPLSVATDLYSHLSHRELIYQFPWLGQASWALVDVSGTIDESPGDVRAAIEQLLDSGWGVVDAADGYILLSAGRGHGDSEIPDEFYDFARAEGDAPEHKLDVTFGEGLRLVGYDVVDDVKWRRTALRFYWEALAPLPEDTEVSVQVLTPDGAAVDDPALRAMPAITWYGPERWQPGEVVRVETFPSYLPREWAPEVTVRVADQRLLPVATASLGAEPVGISSDNRLLLQPWARRGDRLTASNEPDRPSVVDARFSDGQWAVQLAAHATPTRTAPGQQLPVDLRWRNADPSNGQPAPAGAPRDYTVFVHLRGPDGQTVAMGDGMPTWFTVWPSSGWEGDYEMWDAHVMDLPDDLPAGIYTVVVGWYDRETGQRLSVMDEQGNVTGNEFVLTQVSVDPKHAPRPDLCCATVPECCASQPGRAASQR